MLGIEDIKVRIFARLNDDSTENDRDQRNMVIWATQTRGYNRKHGHLVSQDVATSQSMRVPPTCVGFGPQKMSQKFWPPES